MDASTKIENESTVVIEEKAPAKTTTKKTGTTKKTTTKSTAAKKTTSKKATKKASTAKKSTTAKKAPAKKASTTKTTTKKAPAKTTTKKTEVKVELLKTKPLDETKEDLVLKEIITDTEAKAIDKEKLYQYTKSDLWKNLTKAKEIHKEQPFYINILAKEIYDNVQTEETILVQGIIDLYYISEDNKLILIDYKTDNVKKIEELIDKYKTQLSIYKKALENSLNRKVDETYICLLNWGQSLIDSFGHFGTPLTKNSHKIYDKQ